MKATLSVPKPTENAIAGWPRSMCYLPSLANVAECASVCTLPPALSFEPDFPTCQSRIGAVVNLPFCYLSSAARVYR